MTGGGPAGGYAELAAISNFTFLTGASHPEELVARAAELGLSAIAIGDVNSLAGIVRAYAAGREHGMRVLVACRLFVRSGLRIIALPRDRDAYGRLCRLLSLGKLRAEKGGCDLGLRDLLDWGAGLELVLVPPARWRIGDLRAARRQRARFGDRVWLGMAPGYDGRDDWRFMALARLATRLGVRPVAIGDVRMHDRDRRPLADLLSCIRLKTTIDRLGHAALPHAEACLKPPEAMAALFADHPTALAATLEIAAACRFSLAELKSDSPKG